MTIRLSFPLRGALVFGLLCSAMIAAHGKGEVVIKVLCFPRSEEKSTIEMLVGKKEVMEIPLQAHEFTLPKKVARRATWKFGKSRVNAKGEFRFETLATVTPLASDKQLLLFMRRGQKNNDGFVVVPINPATVDGRSYLFFNLTHRPIAGLVGGKKFHLASGQRVVVEPESNRGENLCFASLRYQRDKKWRPFFSSNWRLREKCRSLVFVYHPPGQKTPRIHSVIDPL